MPDIDPALLSAEDMLADFARRQLTPVDVLQAITERVARLNPGLNAFAVMNPGALQAAGRERDPLALRPPDRHPRRRAVHGEGPGRPRRLSRPAAAAAPPAPTRCRTTRRWSPASKPPAR